jgi:hypothetical protein
VETVGRSTPQPAQSLAPPSTPPRLSRKPSRQVKTEQPTPQGSPCLPAYDSSGAQTRACLGGNAGYGRIPSLRESLFHPGRVPSDIVHRRFMLGHTNSMIFRRFSAPGDTNGRVVTCPKTKLRISTGVETDVASLRQSWSQTLRLPTLDWRRFVYACINESKNPSQQTHSNQTGDHDWPALPVIWTSRENVGGRDLAVHGRGLTKCLLNTF